MTTATRPPAVVTGAFAGDTRLEDQLTVVDLNVRAGMTDTKIAAGDKDSPAEIAEAGYEALMAGKDKIVPGATKNELPAAASRVLPDEAKAKQQGKMMKPGSADA